MEENQPYQEPYQDTAQNQTNDQLPTAEEPQEDYEEDDDPDLALAMKMSLESYQEEESMKTEDHQPEKVEEECDTDNESRRVRYDTMATVIEVGDDGEYRIDFNEFRVILASLRKLLTEPRIFIF